MSEQWPQWEQAKAPGWLQRDVEDKRRMEKRQRMEEWRKRKEKRQRMEEWRLRRRLPRMRDGESDIEPMIKYMGADSMDVESIKPGVANEDTEELSLEQDRERRREQQLLAAQEFLREQEMEQVGLELESFTPEPAAPEPLLTEDVMGGLASTESVVVNEDTEELQPLIGGMEADSTDVANQDTEVLLSLEPEQEPRQELGSFPQAPGARREDRERRKVDLEWIFVITNFVLELPSAVFDQLSSVRKPQFALLSMLMSFAALFICIIELVYKCRKEKVTWKWSTLPWLYYPSQKPFGNFKDFIGLVFVICQCVFATIAYNFYIRHADNPIKISALPIIFAFGLLCSKFLRDRGESRSTTRPPVSRGDIHHNLTHYC